MILGYQCQYNGFLELSNTDSLDFGSEQPAQYFMNQVLDFNLARSPKFLSTMTTTHLNYSQPNGITTIIWREGGDSFGWGLFVNINYIQTTLSCFLTIKGSIAGFARLQTLSTDNEEIWLVRLKFDRRNVIGYDGQNVSLISFHVLVLFFKGLSVPTDVYALIPRWTCKRYLTNMGSVLSGKSG